MRERDDRGAQRVGMSASTAYRLRRAPEGRAFAAAWDAAMQQAALALIDAAFERAFNGSEEPVFNRDGQRVGRRMRHSDAMLMFLLRKHFPERYGDLHRDRAPGSAAPASTPVAATLVALEPVRPADPAAALTPGALADALEIADLMDGKLPHWQRPDGAAEPDPRADLDPAAPVLGEEFEAKLEAAKRTLDPPWYTPDDDDDWDDR